MKKLMLIMSLFCIMTACKNSPVEGEYIDYEKIVNSYKDSLSLYKDSIITLNDSMYHNILFIDTLYYKMNEKNYMIDSLQEELIVAQYKLERIKEYNKIAANGNNIKYLRGWINRVLSE